METLRKTFAALSAMLFILSGILALLAFNIEWKAFDSAVYKQAFEQQNLYERTPDILANVLYGFVSENPNTDPYLKELTIEDWRATIASLVPPAELKTLTNNSLDSVFDYLNGRNNAAVISLAPIKAHLVGPGGVELIRKILRAQPACTADQLLQIGMGLLSGDIALCNPPEQMLGLMIPLIESQAQLITLSIPNEITLLASTPGSTSNDPRVGLNQIRTLMKITPIFPIFFLFCITAFGTRTLMDWLQWWGYPFLITGATGSLIAWLGSTTLGIIVQRILQIYTSGFLPPLMFSVLQETVNAVTAEILRPVMIEGLILAAPGFAMVLTAIFLSYQGKR